MRVCPALVASGTAMVVAPIGKGGCTPAWDGSGSLTGSAIVNRINAIRKAGGDVVVSFAKGISSMNGRTDEGETVTVANFMTMLSFIQQNHMAGSQSGRSTATGASSRTRWTSRRSSASSRADPGGRKGWPGGVPGHPSSLRALNHAGRVVTP